MNDENPICKERGHIRGNSVVTLLGSVPSYIDYPDRTEILHHDPNTRTFTCLRCKQKIIESVQKNPYIEIITKTSGS